MPDKEVNRAKLRAVIAAKQIARGGIDQAYTKLDDYKRLKKRLSKQKKDVGSVDIQIEALENELEKLEESIASAQLGTNIEAGGGFSSGGCAGGD